MGRKSLVDAEDFGFEDVAVLDGGWVKWTAEDREVSMDPPVDRGPITFIDHGSSGLLVTKNVVVDALTAPGTVIVNSLSAEQHNGETADYGRRGHIPGALNVPTPGLVNPDTHVFLAPGRVETENGRGPRGRRRTGHHVLRWRDLCSKRGVRDGTTGPRERGYLRWIDERMGRRPVATARVLTAVSNAEYMGQRSTPEQMLGPLRWSYVDSATTIREESS